MFVRQVKKKSKRKAPIEPIIQNKRNKNTYQGEVKRLYEKYHTNNERKKKAMSIGDVELSELLIVKLQSIIIKRVKQIIDEITRKKSSYNHGQKFDKAKESLQQICFLLERYYHHTHIGNSMKKLLKHKEASDHNKKINTIRKTYHDDIGSLYKEDKNLQQCVKLLMMYGYIKGIDEYNKYLSFSHLAAHLQFIGDHSK